MRIRCDVRYRQVHSYLHYIHGTVIITRNKSDIIFPLFKITKSPKEKQIKTKKQKKEKKENTVQVEIGWVSVKEMGTSEEGKMTVADDSMDRPFSY